LPGICSNANYGGANVGLGNLAISNPYVMFSNCTYIVPANQTGYQDPNGFATRREICFFSLCIHIDIEFSLAPSYLDFIDYENPCPVTQYLDATGSNIEVFLFDQLGTLVTGNYLDSFATFVNLTYSGTVQLSTVNNSYTTLIEPDTGGAAFAQVVLSGHNNSTAKLLFSPSDLSIAQISCSISLLGCPEGYEVLSGDLYDTCEPSKKNNFISF
jgi:hypothetical protein